MTNEMTVVEAPVAKFWRYNQNNSGGTFQRDENVSHFVFIEAHSADDADHRAESVGIYFDGCATERDCPCCGDRWCRVYDDAVAEPTIYGEPIGAYYDMFCPPGETYAIVHHLDGHKNIYRRMEVTEQPALESKGD